MKRLAHVVLVGGLHTKLIRRVQLSDAFLAYGEDINAGEINVRRDIEDQDAGEIDLVLKL
jgi:hypothetical protein